MSIQTNHYRATLRPSSDFSDFRTVTRDDSAYSIIVGTDANGSWKVQSILFPKAKYNLAQATIQAYYLERDWI